MLFFRGGGGGGGGGGGVRVRPLSKPLTFVVDENFRFTAAFYFIPALLLM